MVFEIEHCNLVYKLGMVTTQSEQEILFEIVTISPVTPVTNSVSAIFSKNNLITLISFLILSHPCL